ncbi:helix-turn-helix transcriptional regulator [Pedobacter aquae]|uniref:Helix-turn-helix transcriptional regulator n=1 Tax=Pedobacter aquae TaxID=2605747 RepID=A0A5C0VF30_9SPHI|nr:helix-turn-helix transcriptional regulator [Pedobacter aquae]QEK50472.1 helix-turn-helix transcriptional regulator [Pedobacter aquae]
MKKEIGIITSIFRKESALKQEFMAYKLGLTVNSYANIEKGRTDINTEKLIKISQIFNIKPYQILVLADELLENNTTDWLPQVVRAIIRVAKRNYAIGNNLEDQFIISMDKSVRNASLKTRF